MKFTLDESHSDICRLVRQLSDAEQALRSNKGGDPELRALLNRSSRMLDECRSLMMSAVNSLEEAARLRAGLMDSPSRHEEIARQKNRAMETTVEFLKSLLKEHTPTAPPKRVHDEVI